MAAYRHVGIVGGGQLARMMAQEVRRNHLPYHVLAVDPTDPCPARPYLHDQIVGDFKDAEAIGQLADRADYVTFEIELADADALDALRQSGKPVHPSPETLRTIQDKYAQKRFLRDRGFLVPDLQEVAGYDDIRDVGSRFGYPLIVKAKRDSYDGRGNVVVGSEDDIRGACEQLNGRDLFVERYVDFDAEVSVMVARSTRGEIMTYEVGENVHENSILQMTIVPARVDPSIAEAAQEIAKETLEALQGAGVFGIEMFVDGEDIHINEIAPRVHNSGHHTIEACRTSQFEQHVRAITGMPLGDTSLVYPVVMHNILSGPDETGAYAWDGVEDALALPGVSVHQYGKKELGRAGEWRKMGHLTAVDGSVPLDGLIQRAETARERIRFKSLG